MKSLGRLAAWGGVLGVTVGLLAVLAATPEAVLVAASLATEIPPAGVDGTPGPDARPGASQALTTSLQLDRVLTVRDYIVLVSALYAVDGDLERARERLTQLGLKDPVAEVARLAEELLGKNQGKSLVVDLATLAQALGAKRPDLMAYVATPTATPTAKPKVRAAATSTPVPPTPTPLPTLEWDIRLSAKLEPPVKVVPAKVQPGQTYWRLTRAWWQDPEEGHQAFHIFANVLRKDGVPIPQPIIIENGGKLTVPAQPKPDSEYLINYPMAGTLGSYTCYVAGDLPSDKVVGLGLGFAKGGKDHTCFLLTFQETVAQ